MSINVMTVVIIRVYIWFHTVFKFIYEPQSVKTCLIIKDFLCFYEKHKKILTCLYIVLKPIQVDSRIKLAIISD